MLLYMTIQLIFILVISKMMSLNLDNNLLNTLIWLLFTTLIFFLGMGLAGGLALVRNMPLGTVVGIYYLWVYLSEKE